MVIFGVVWIEECLVKFISHGWLFFLREQCGCFSCLDICSEHSLPMTIRTLLVHVTETPSTKYVEAFFYSKDFQPDMEVESRICNCTYDKYLKCLNCWLIEK